MRPTAAAAVALPSLLTSLGAARADGCSELWFNRNQVYKGAGSCFKACLTTGAGLLRDVPLSEKDRGAVGGSAREEAGLGCRP